jgi:Zn-dependent protease with chaperone function
MGYVLVVGDASGSADVLLGLPVLMATLSYSRHHEREADAFSAALLDQRGIKRDAFVNLMRRLGHSARCERLIEETALLNDEELTDSRRLELCEELMVTAESGAREERPWRDYLSTHPGLHKRLEDFIERY